MSERLPLSIVIPTYRREQVLLDTLRFLLAMNPRALEILVVDQSESHETKTAKALAALEREGSIRWIRLSRPSITHAMNLGLEQALADIVLFLDDDIVPDAGLLAAHATAHLEGDNRIVAGQVLQPGEAPRAKDAEAGEFRFSSSRRQWIDHLMGGNFSVNRAVAIGLGGFDENFVHVAYRFEAEFCDRAATAGERILFEPEASIRHLKAPSGGTRTFGSHLTTLKPSHSVGEYYFLLRAKHVRNRFARSLRRIFGSVATRHHMTHPWWIPVTLVSEVAGLLWALQLSARGPRLLGARESAATRQVNA